MPLQTAEIFVPKPALVAQLNGVGPALRQLAEKRVEVGHEIPSVLIIARPKPRKLEHEHAYLGADFLTRFEECRRQQISVERITIGLARLRPKSGQVRIFSDGDGIRDLQPEPEILGHRIRQFVQILAAGKIVIGRIHAHGLENFGVFLQAIPLKARFGNFPPILVARWSVKLPKPAFAFPARSADIHAFGGQFRRRFRDLFALEWHGMKLWFPLRPVNAGRDRAEGSGPAADLRVRAGQMPAQRRSPRIGLRLLQCRITSSSSSRRPDRSAPRANTGSAATPHMPPDLPHPPARRSWSCRKPPPSAPPPPPH